MNERIRELRRQATLVETYTTNNGTVVEGKHVDLEKFAELIVKKCAYLVNHQQRTTGYTTHARMLCEEFGIEFKDEDYFGVEE